MKRLGNMDVKTDSILGYSRSFSEKIKEECRQYLEKDRFKAELWLN